MLWVGVRRLDATRGQSLASHCQGQARPTRMQIRDELGSPLERATRGNMGSGAAALQPLRFQPQICCGSHDDVANGQSDGEPGYDLASGQ